MEKLLSKLFDNENINLYDKYINMFSNPASLEIETILPDTILIQYKKDCVKLMEEVKLFMIRDLFSGEYVGQHADGKYDFFDIESSFGATGVNLTFSQDVDLVAIDTYLGSRYPDRGEPFTTLVVPTMKLYKELEERNAS